MTMEAKKIYSLLFASWISRQTIGIIKSKSQGPRIRIANVGGQERVREKMNLFPLLLFVLFGPLIEWMLPIYFGVGSLLSSVHKLKCLSLSEPLLQTHPEIMFYQHLPALLSPVKLTYRINHHKEEDTKDSSEFLWKYWVGQNVLSGFSISCYRKTPMNFLGNPVLSGDNIISKRPSSICRTNNVY